MPVIRTSVRLFGGAFMYEVAKYSERWRNLFKQNSPLHRRRQFWKRFPKSPRCALCYVPFGGIGGFMLRTFMNTRRSSLNPRWCNVCDTFITNYPGGTETTLTLLFADVRGSTSIAQRLSIIDFTEMMNRFFAIGTRAMIETDGVIEKFMGDQVAGIYLPAFAGENYTERALEAAQTLLWNTGHGSEEGPWISVGIGVHSGTAFVGVVGEDVTQLSVLGDAANAAARLSSEAAAGEILISEAAVDQVKLDVTGLEHRILELKGRAEPMGVYVLYVDTPLQMETEREAVLAS
jgi:adenylate cyclase